MLSYALVHRNRHGWECVALPEPLNPRVQSKGVQPEGVHHQPGAVSAGLEPNAGRSGRDTVILARSAFLKQQLRAGRWSLSGHGSDGTPRFSHEKGHLFSAFFISQALEGGLDETERTLLLVRLLSEEAGGHWGYSPRGYAPGRMTTLISSMPTTRPSPCERCGNWACIVRLSRCCISSAAGGAGRRRDRAATVAS